MFRSPMKVMLQLVSIFTIYNDQSIVCIDGGQCDLTNSNSSFGRLGLSTMVLDHRYSLELLQRQRQQRQIYLKLTVA